MQAFEYLAADSLDAARAALAANPEARLLAGGMSLLPAMKLRLATPELLVDLNRIAGLAGIEASDDALVVGALARHADVAASSLVRATLPMLAALAEGIGDAQVRNRGTLGGALANNDPAADYPAAALALNAEIVTDRRRIPADAFFTDMFATALAADEIVTAVRFPRARRAAYAKFPNPASRYAIVGVCVAETAAGVRVAVTGAGACVFRASAFEEALSREFSVAALAGLTVDADDLNADLYASAEYRAHLVGVMAARAVAACA